MTDFAKRIRVGMPAFKTKDSGWVGRIVDNNLAHEDTGQANMSCKDGIYWVIRQHGWLDSYAVNNYVATISLHSAAIFPWTNGYFPTVHVTLTGGGGTGATAHDAVIGWQDGHEGTVAELKGIAVDEGGQNYTTSPTVELQWVNGPPAPPSPTLRANISPWGFFATAGHGIAVDDRLLIRWLYYDIEATPITFAARSRFFVRVAAVTDTEITVDRDSGYPNWGDDIYSPADTGGGDTVHWLGQPSYFPVFEFIEPDNATNLNKYPGRFAIYKYATKAWHYQDRDGGPLPIGTLVSVSNEIKNAAGLQVLSPQYPLGNYPYWGVEGGIWWQ